LDWSEASTWEFFPVDMDAFPAVELARRAGAAGGTAPAVFNAANETAVQAFLAERATYVDIVDTVAALLDEHLAGPTGGGYEGRPGIGQGSPSLTVDEVLGADRWARERAGHLLATAAHRNRQGEP
jgi:1-deoxy-D-xylulose-5-phosphate reductoisomerase